MSYRVGLAPAAKTELKKLNKKAPKKVMRAIADAIDSLKENPRPHGTEKLSVVEGLYRIRKGNFRIIYQVRDEELLVLIVKVADRKEAYDRILKEAKRRIQAHTDARTS
ncbi:MAG: type II toxin-antitoxin system RelE/ParE family toxin [Rhodospirillales bacterium]|jgi:mRNA interferase RelE/StbE|nr:type II toxin-antitoxin system RelE/ParE family toxin [Rhodospirillales bacterium]MBT4040270.1 type II toxin-antitoxin system RelE/ParE family toxin [Rhodospirillales bacterium]MBT4626525.1 type II toxin-antitoxin system RelE/ParE family toxin [Rhodospirillales bacterium]MBT5352816.1 type II toxin-antitoxin system RelE/ParE family toxin [Rhodospirillales bacterium]MBT5520136.1 type II toxin-antitoxin system RelE/ParE family toxin [Rhodospirillales bacterium]